MDGTNRVFSQQKPKSGTKLLRKGIWKGGKVACQDLLNQAPDPARSESFGGGVDRHPMPDLFPGALRLPDRAIHLESAAIQLHAAEQVEDDAGFDLISDPWLVEPGDVQKPGVISDNSPDE